jgi:hypothetical protein
MPKAQQIAICGDGLLRFSRRLLRLAVARRRYAVLTLEGAIEGSLTPSPLFAIFQRFSVDRNSRRSACQR